MTAPQIVTLKTLPELPKEWMKELNTEAEAVEFATTHKQAFVYHFPPNKRYYVAAPKQVTP